MLKGNESSVIAAAVLLIAIIAVSGLFLYWRSLPEKRDEHGRFTKRKWYQFGK